jgi:predicted lysophospholipase L1 biosynthesis ABC-type transport system permease subunit
MDSAVKIKVAIVDESLARQLWPEGDALGKRIAFRDDGTPDGFIEVIGVVPALRDSLLDPRNQPHVYVPFGQLYQSNLHFHLKFHAAGPAAEAALMRDVRQAIRSADENLPILNLKTMREQLAGSIDMWLFGTGARMLSLLGGLALMLAAVGVYGLRAYVIARRTREIGIRMSLGATVRGTLWMTLREGAWLTLFGTAVGLALAVLTGRLLSSLLYEVSPADPIVLVAVPLLLNGVALLASYFPARRAASMDPMSALRYE